MSKKQIRNLNRRFELGVYRRKTIADYPTLHAYLARLFGEAHTQLLQGGCVKLTLGQQWILDTPHQYDCVSQQFWFQKIGDYRVMDCKATSCFVHLIVDLPSKKDTFYFDDYVLLTSLATCQIFVSDRGKLQYIDLDLNTKPPRFIRDLARDFSMGGSCARKRLRKRIIRMGEEPDGTFLAPIKFGRAITIQVE